MSVMSRYILTPGQCQLDDPTKESFFLVPEGIGEKPRYIELPKGLVPQLSPWNRSIANMLLKLSKTNVTRSKDGFLKIRNRVLNNVNYDKFISDCCRGEFSSRYENIYCELRKNGVTF